MHERDFDYIISALDKKCPDSQGRDWYWILGFLQANRAAGMFAESAERSGLAVPEDIMGVLRTQKQENAARNAVLRRHIISISEAFEKYGPEQYAFLKGAVLSNALMDQTAVSLCHFRNHLTRGLPSRKLQVYSTGERMSNDIDLLVRPQDLTAADKALRGLGFAQGYWDKAKECFVTFDRREIVSRRMNRGETAPYIKVTQEKPLKYIEVDVNFSLDGLPSGRQGLLDEMLAATRDYPCRDGGPGIRSLAPEYFLIQLILHQCKESQIYSMVKRGKSDMLYKYEDIKRLLRNSQYGGELFYSAVKRFSLQNEVCRVLSCVKDIYGLLCAPEAEVLLQENENIPDSVVTDYDGGHKRYVYTDSVRGRLIKHRAERGLAEYEEA